MLPLAALVSLVVFAPAKTIRFTQGAIAAVAWPILKSASIAKDKLNKVSLLFRDQAFLRRQNAQLLQQLDQTSVGAIQLAELRAENIRLKNLLQFKESAHPQALMARVIGYDPSGWTQSLMIDKGASDGVLVNQAVISAHGIVGRIAQVTAFSSKVLLLLDNHIRIGAMLENSRDVGIVEGHEPAGCRMLYLPKDTVIALGQNVLTSGLGGIFPKAILIGKVTGVGLDELGLYQVAELQPAVNIAKLEEVLILTTGQQS